MVEFSYFILCGLLFSIVLNILYFSGKHVKSEETKIFSFLIVINLISLFSELACSYIGHTFIENTFISQLATKLYLVCLMTFLLFMTLYIYVICYISNKKIKVNYYNKLEKISYVIWFICVIVCVFLPITTSKGYATGLSVSWVYLCSTLVLLEWLIPFIKNFKNIDKKKAFPLVLFAVFMAIISSVQKAYPQVTLTTVMESLIIFIMYHTIENPDVKLIAELEVARDVAEKASHAKSDFLSSMSHEIRTPLNAIVGLSEDMKEYSEHMPKEVLEDIEDIGNASNTLLEIVGNILDINKIESGKMELVSIPYNLVEEVKNLVSVTTTRIGTKPIDFKLELSSDLPYILLGDKVHIKGIINNFLSNAIKYTEKGSIVLSISSVNREEDCTIFIRVTDTGKGIREEDMPHLFGKFERLDVVKNSTIEGTGLGLAITKNLVEMMGGKIGVESEFGKGSVFYAEIPQKIHTLESPVEVIEVFDVPEENTGYGNKKILLVDDNKLNIKVARKALDPFGFEITECSNGVEALEQVENNTYDLILMDIMMPIMGGEEAMEKLREMPDFHTPVIALTADAVDGARERYLSLGFVDYLAKPFTKKELQEKLDALWKK